MRIRLTQIMTSVMAAIVIVSTGGCSGVWSDTGMPLVVREKVEFPVPTDSLKYPLTTPTSAEEKGVLLRYKLQPHKFKYNSQFIRFTEVVGDQGYKQTQKSSEIVRYLPAPDRTNLIRENQVKFGLVGGMRRRSLISPRGGCLKSLDMKPTGFGSVTAGDPFSSFETQSSDLFPEDAVRADQTWTQYGQQQAKQFSQASNVIWQLLGFAQVRGHRCAVLQGTDIGMNVTETEIEDRYEHKVIFYFDYERGLDVESIVWRTGERISRRKLSKYAMFWQTSLAE